MKQEAKKDSRPPERTPEGGILFPLPVPDCAFSAPSDGLIPRFPPVFRPAHGPAAGSLIAKPEWAAADRACLSAPGGAGPAASVSFSAGGLSAGPREGPKTSCGPGRKILPLNRAGGRRMIDCKRGTGKIGQKEERTTHEPRGPSGRSLRVRREGGKKEHGISDQ